MFLLLMAVVGEVAPVLVEEEVIMGLVFVGVEGKEPEVGEYRVGRTSMNQSFLVVLFH